jgi:hypothetical protein
MWSSTVLLRRGLICKPSTRGFACCVPPFPFPLSLDEAGGSPSSPTLLDDQRGRGKRRETAMLNYLIRFSIFGFWFGQEAKSDIINDNSNKYHYDK